MPSPAPRIAVVDYGAGNLRSVAKALARSGLDPRITSDPAVVRDARGVVLPGAGAFAEAIEQLDAKGLSDAIRESIAAGQPYLGLCLGLQLLFEESDEHGHSRGLCVLPGRVQRFGALGEDKRPRCVPHIGWNEVRFDGAHPLCASLPPRDYFYFVHSHYAVPTRAALSAGRCNYGGWFTAAAAHENIFAVQFHPEKSQTAGKRLLDAFANWMTSCA